MIHQHKKGMVLMIVLTTITLLIVIVQQIAFDTQVEYKNGVSNYRSLRAYYSAKSGVELALLKILTYRKIHELLKGKNIESLLGPEGSSLIRQYTDQIWQQPFSWPPALPEDLSDIRKGEVQDIIQESLMDLSYTVQIAPEGSRINLNDMASPMPPVRQWTQNTFYNLLVHLRNQNKWLMEKYSVNDLREIQQNILKAMQDPGHFIGRSLTYFNELEKIEKISPELMEYLRPYISFYAVGGIQLQYASPIIMQSLHENMDQNTSELLVHQRDNKDQTEENPRPLYDFDKTTDLWMNQNLNFLTSYYSQKRENEPELHSVVFNYNAPRNFRITSRGADGQSFHIIETVFYDPHSAFERVFTKMTELKKESGYKPLQESDPGYQDVQYESSNVPKNQVASPFIIYWKDVN